MIKETELKLDQIDQELAALREKSKIPQLRIWQLEGERKKLLEAYADLTPADKVYLARRPKRPGIRDFTAALFQDFFELRGDRLNKDDKSILGGVAFYHGIPVTVIGHCKGKNLEENMYYNFGMPGPEGYRKSLRLMKQAEKFGRPIITFIDTPGAFPGLEAETNGQSEAIARNLAAMSQLTVPVIAIVTGEGGSGGALALGVANRLLMLENAVYSVLSPEGFASILWKDSTRSAEASGMMKLTAQDLLQFGVADEIIAEPLGGAHRNHNAIYSALDEAILRNLKELLPLSDEDLANQRYDKFRKIGTTKEAI
ncbi:MAG: acetyl-CoA carboxylase carboxyltransferase subunit alpha [Clostridium sp.]|uniref:acetyl-CoA carboxylase carboxyltransferase subunit alpha n=1 Tax=Clostridium sp. TaxID=1506 RepID=UPI0029113A01|nr:acetyl-CoA carboxylase carboxyltransferase subunit alpha [Clostridium sp.]MDU7337086.1 acetyl-CoA carboxylase carboxyltransferase subunit alpha [Clostridium sp.]